MNGGVVASDCSKCICPAGYSGLDCHGGFTVTPLAGCAEESKQITISWKFGGDAKAPTQNSFMALYPATETNTFNMAHAVYMCGNSYKADSNGGLCPNTGSVTFKNKFPKAGHYKVALVEYQPPNEFGQDGYATMLTADNTIAVISSLETAKCSISAVEAAEKDNSPVTALEARLAELKAEEDREQAAEDARLDVVEPMLDKLHDAPTGSPSVAQEAEIILSGADPEDPVLWGSAAAVSLCYTLPTSMNENPKAMVLYTGDGSSGSFFPTGIQKAGFDDPLPQEAQGCVETSFSPGLPDGAYTIKLQKKWTPVFATKSFYLANANVDFSGFAYNAKQLSLWIKWSVTQAKASNTDVIKVYNSEGAVVYWFYTSCGCQGTPAETASHAGEVQINLLRAGTVAGGYDLGFYPSGGEFQAANAPDWIDWEAIGW